MSLSAHTSVSPSSSWSVGHVPGHRVANVAPVLVTSLPPVIISTKKSTMGKEMTTNFVSPKTYYYPTASSITSTSIPTIEPRRDHQPSDFNENLVMNSAPPEGYVWTTVSYPPVLPLDTKSPSWTLLTTSTTTEWPKAMTSFPPNQQAFDFYGSKRADVEALTGNNLDHGVSMAGGAKREETPATTVDHTVIHYKTVVPVPSEVLATAKPGEPISFDHIITAAVAPTETPAPHAIHARDLPQLKWENIPSEVIPAGVKPGDVIEGPVLYSMGPKDVSTASYTLTAPPQGVHARDLPMPTLRWEDIPDEVIPAGIHPGDVIEGPVLYSKGPNDVLTASYTLAAPSQVHARSLPTPTPQLKWEDLPKDQLPADLQPGDIFVIEKLVMADTGATTGPYTLTRPPRELHARSLSMPTPTTIERRAPLPTSSPYAPIVIHSLSVREAFPSDLTAESSVGTVNIPSPTLMTAPPKRIVNNKIEGRAAGDNLTLELKARLEMAGWTITEGTEGLTLISKADRWAMIRPDGAKINLSQADFDKKIAHAHSTRAEAEGIREFRQKLDAVTKALRFRLEQMGGKVTDTAQAKFAKAIEEYFVGSIEDKELIARAEKNTAGTSVAATAAASFSIPVFKSTTTVFDTTTTITATPTSPPWNATEKAHKESESMAFFVPIPLIASLMFAAILITAFTSYIAIRFIISRGWLSRRRHRRASSHSSSSSSSSTLSPNVHARDTRDLANHIGDGGSVSGWSLKRFLRREDRKAVVDEEEMGVRTGREVEFVDVGVGADTDGGAKERVEGLRRELKV